jgi:PAS domain S-box-containing protein
MAQEKLGRLIIVDDEIDTLNPLCDLLYEWGYEVKGFTSGKEALEALKKQGFDLLLTDLVMPEIDGIELMKAAMEIAPLIVCIIITGKGTIQTAVEAMKVGAFDYVLKPIEWKAFKPILSRTMEVCRLRRSEEKYRVIIEDLTELVCRWKPGEILTFVNEAYCRYFNKKPEELIGHSFMSFIPEENWDNVRKHLASLGQENPVSTHKHRVLCSDGEICWQQWTNRAFFDKKGNIIEYQSVGQDITKRKRAEEALKESEEKFRELSGSITDVFFAMDKDLKYIYWNKASENLTGISEKDAIGKSLYELFPDTPEMRKAEGIYLDVLRTQQPQNFINRYQIKDKEYYFEINAYPSKQGLSVFAKDITERKRMEEELRVSEARYRDLYDNAPDMYHALDENGVILDCNKTEARMLGYEKREIIGKHITDFFTEESKGLFESSFVRLKQVGTLQNIEREFIRKDGTTFPASLNVFSVYDKNRKFIGTKTIARDISVLKQAESALRDSEEKYRTLVDNALVGVYKTNLKGDFLFVNEALARIMEFDSPEEMMAESVPKRYKNPKDREVLIGKLRGNNKVENFEVDLLTKTGKTRNVFLSATLEGDTISGMIMDITKRKKAEEALKESEGKLNAMLQSIGDHMSMLDKNLNIIWANDIAKKIFGDEIIGKKCYETYHGRKEPCEPYPCFALKAFQDGKVHEHETQVVDKDGNIIYFHCTANVALRDEEKNPAAVIEISRNITERKQAEEELKRSEERLRSLADAAFEAIIFHKEGILISANNQFFKMFGYEPDELIGKQIIPILVTPDTREYMKKQIATGRLGPYESIGLKKDGTVIPVEIRVREMEYYGEKIRVVAIMDIREHKKREEQMKKSYRQLRDLAARLSEVEEAEKRQIAQELHDQVGQNLTVLGINLNIIRSQISKKSAKLADYRLRDSLELLEKTTEIIRNVMSDLRPSILDDYGLLAGIRWYSEKFSVRTNIAVTIHGKELTLRLPISVETTMFRITQEALTNIAKHSQAQKAFINLEERDDKVQLSIADDGIGFDPETVYKMKKEMVWGLHAIKERAEALGGKFIVESKPGKGTKIIVEIKR